MSPHLNRKLHAHAHFTHKPRAIRDHGIVTTQKKVSKGRPKTPQTHVLWSRTLKCSVKLYVTGPSTKCYSDEFLFMWVLAHTVVSIRSVMVSRFCVRPTFKR